MAITLNNDDHGFDSQDHAFMERAIALAKALQGKTAPNPTVGAVVVKNGCIVGEGAHPGPGQPHAEVLALRQAGESAKGSTVYVTLEPCCHWGRTPPCTDALISSGVARVVAAMRDPNPLVSCRGFTALEDAGILVSRGLMGEEAERLNEGFIKHITTGLPFVTAKWAMTLDGRIATSTGHSTWITSTQARDHARELRARHGSVMVGVGTILADDPRLTAPLGWGHPMNRIILDSELRTPCTSKVFDSPDPLVILCRDDACHSRQMTLEHAGARIERLPDRGPRDIGAVLRRLGTLGITSVWAEGGSQVLGSLLDNGGIDRVCAYVAPRVLGDVRGVPPVSGSPKNLMDSALNLTEVEWERVGEDFYMTGLLKDGRIAPCSPD